MHKIFSFRLEFLGITRAQRKYCINVSNANIFSDGLQVNFEAKNIFN